MRPSSTYSSKTKSARNCRNLLMSSRVRRDMMADRLDADWERLRRHASVEMDTEKLLRIMAECGKRKRKADLWSPRIGG